MKSDIVSGSHLDQEMMERGTFVPAAVFVMTYHYGVVGTSS